MLRALILRQLWNSLLLAVLYWLSLVYLEEPHLLL